MKIMTKFIILAMLCLAMISCNKKKDEIKTSTGGNDRTKVIDTDVTNSDPVRTYTYDGNTYKDICCDTEDLSNPQSLLSQRVILFSYDQSTVESRFRDIIEIHARYLSKNPSAKMVLEGHADERGTPEYNLALGERRGNSVANLMRAQGASAGQISVVSFGEEKPVALCNNDSCWSQNRRVRIVYTAK